MINLHELARSGLQAAWLQFSPLLEEARQSSSWWVLVIAILLVILLLAWAWRSYNHEDPDAWKPYSITPAPPPAPETHSPPAQTMGEPDDLQREVNKR